jgi:hypothetical protein
MKFAIPITVVHYEPGSTQDVTLRIELPKYNFSVTKTVSIVSVAADTELVHQPAGYVEFETFTSKDPQRMIITCTGLEEWATCIVFRPIIKNLHDVEPVVQTISLKKDNVEIATPIANLHPAYNFKNWVNVWLKHNESVAIRYFCDTLLTKEAYLAKNL